MSNKLKIKEVSEKTLRVAKSYPFVLIASAIMTIAAISLAESEEHDSFILAKILLVSGLGISLSFGIHIWAQRERKSVLWPVLGLLLLTGLYFLLPEKKEYFTEKYIFLFVPLYVMSHLWVAFAPFLKHNTHEESFWQYNKSLFIQLVLTLIFTGVLIGGVELAILAVDNLFDMNFKDSWYFDTLLFLSIWGSSFIFLLFNADGLVFLEQKTDFPIVLKFFTQFILIPLLLIYGLILYLYSIKILIEWELPRGWVTYMIMAYTVLGILALLLVYPLRESSKKSWVKIFSKVFYYTLIPLLVLLYVAIFTRILEYGYTEARYFVLLLSLWLTLQVVYFVSYKKSNIKFIPISLFIFGAFSLVVPYLNTFSVAVRSQKSELMNLLTDNDLLVNKKIDFTKEVSEKAVDEIQDKFVFLEKRHERTFLENLVSSDDLKKITNNSRNYWSLKSRFSHVIPVEKTTAVSNYIRIYNNHLIHEIKDYDYVFQMPNDRNENEFRIGDDTFKLESGFNKLVLVLNDKARLDVMEKLNLYLEKHPGLTDGDNLDDFSTEEILKGYRVKVIFDSANIILNTSEKPHVDVSSYIILLKKEKFGD